ncbi:OB-fold domain-containing protein [Massilia sp.]|uniref:Zn-ribbon domain-containing OB-fold protein n=1 Tax=Massilia sp. TaxID=1882437 RepID=UPI00289B6E1F|nr:OB-fold domain-containing protein [Massilia sp.]
MTRKLPALSTDNRAFWQGGADGELRMHHCEACAQFFHPPAPVCPRCLASDVASRAVSGAGTVVTYTVNHQPWRSDLKDPYVVAIVELPEQAGLRFVTNIVGTPPGEVFIGMPVRVRFEQHDDVWLPLFERAA